MNFQPSLLSILLRTSCVHGYPAKHGSNALLLFAALAVLESHVFAALVARNHSWSIVDLSDTIERTSQLSRKRTRTIQKKKKEKTPPS